MIVAWPILQAFLKANWKYVILVAGLVALWSWHKIEVNRAWYEGRAALRAEQAEEAKRRHKDAQEADAAVRECARDPACLLRKDPNRRD